jgi:adenylate cyclase
MKRNQLFEEALRAYFDREWARAGSLFRKSLEAEMYEENPSQVFIKRCEMMSADPPPEDWNGVFVMEQK